MSLKYYTPLYDPLTQALSLLRFVESFLLKKQSEETRCLSEFLESRKKIKVS